MNVGILRHFRWLAVVGLGLLVLANSIVTWTKVTDLVEAQARVTHTLAVRQVISRATHAVTSAETALRRHAQTGDRQFLDQYKDMERHLVADVQELRQLTSDNAGQRQRLDRLSAWPRSVDGVPADAAQSLATLSAAARAMDQEEVALLALRSERSDTSARVAFLTIAAATFGNLVLLAGVYCLAMREVRRSRRDAAQIRDSQQRLQLVLDNIPQRIFWKDLESRFVGCNKAFASDFGVASPEDLVGRTDYDIQPAHTASAFRADDKEVMTHGQEKVGYEEPLIRLDGDTAWLRTSKIPLRGPDGELLFPNALAYPEDVIKAEFGPFTFTSSIAYMLAKAIEDCRAQNIARIGLFGIMQASQNEYAYQRPGIQNLIVEACRRGIEVTAPQESRLFEPMPEIF